MPGNMAQSGGQNMSFTNEKARFHTNTQIGFAHASLGTAKGNVFGTPIHQSPALSLWLEHVCDKLEPARNGSIYWLIWYDDQAWPNTLAPSVLERDAISTLSAMLASFLQLP